MSVSALFFKTPIQARTFLLLFLSGMISGILLFSLQKAAKYLPKAVSAACQAVFLFVLLSLCALCLAWGKEENLRWYAVPGMMCGCALSAGFMHLSEKAFLFLLKACRKEGK